MNKRCQLLAKGLMVFVVACGSFFPVMAQEAGRVVKMVPEEQAPYYRFWRGFKKDGLTFGDFHDALVSDFMPATVKVHSAEGLKSYLVILPPTSASRLIPDEIALVAYASRNVYQTITKTAHGMAYQKKHGDIFAPKVSRSLVPVPFQQLAPGDFRRECAVDVLHQPVDWQTGHSIFFFGFRKSTLPPDSFWDRLYKHVRYVKAAFVPFGLKGYIVLLSPDYEMAFLNWDTRAGMEKSLSSRQGQALIKDAQSILDTHMWKDFRDFDGTVAPGECVNYKFPRP